MAKGSDKDEARFISRGTRANAVPLLASQNAHEGNAAVTRQIRCTRLQDFAISKFSRR